MSRRIFAGALTAILGTASLTAAQHQTGLDDFQSTERHESVPAMLEFMAHIAELEPAIRDNLLQARLLNTVLHIDPTKDTLPYMSNEVDVLDNFQEVPWRMVLRTQTNPPVFGWEQYVLVIVLDPDATLLQWIRSYREYNDYAKTKIHNDRFLFFLSGRIASYTWKRTRGSYDQRSLELVLSDYVIESIRTNPLTDSHTCSGSVQQTTQLLQRMTAGWVRYYMGRSSKPKTHVCLQ